MRTKSTFLVLFSMLLFMLFGTTVHAQSLQTPWLLSPNFNPNVNTNPVHLTWWLTLGNLPLPEGETYHLQVATNSSFSSVVYDVSGLTSGVDSNFVASPSTTYQWRVRVESATDSSAWTAGWFSTTSTLPAVASYTITASAGANGAISPSGPVSVSPGDSAEFLISPSTGYHISDVLVDDTSKGAITNYTFTNVNANHTISASFAINTYTITVTPSVTNGTITASGIVDSVLTVNYGDTPTFTITPNSGYEIESITVDGSTSVPVTDPSGQSYQFAAVTSNHTITASFVINNNYYVNASLGKDSAGYGSSSGSGAFKTIQYAINNVPSGSIINIATGTYNSFSIVGKTNLTLKGAGKDSTIINPSSLITTGVAHKYTANMTAVAFVNNSTGIEISGMTIKSNSSTPGAGGPDGIVFWNASTGTINNCNITGTYTISGAQTGQGLAVDAGGEQTTTLTVSGTAISGFQKNAIDAIDGNSNTSNAGTINLTVSNCSITGAGPVPTITQNGILVWNRGGGTVEGTVSGTSFSGLVNDTSTTIDNDACAILTYGTSSANISTISNCTFASSNQLYIATFSGGNINATNNNSFSGVSTASATDSQIFTIEKMIEDKMDDPAKGLVTLKTGNLYVSNSGTDNSIQNGINAASSGDTLNVNAGVYNESININKSLVLLSAFGYDTTEITGTGQITATINSNDVAVDGFKISNPSGKQGIYSADHSGITFINNYIDSVGTSDATASGTNAGIMVVCSSVPVDSVTITGNTVSNIAGGNFKSADGIVLGFSSGSYNYTNVTIENNTISNITSSTIDYSSGGRGAYGILLNHGTGTTGKTVSPVIWKNTISNLNGLWAHGIGLEGNTPNASVQRNTIDSLTDHKAPSDAIAIHVEDDASLGSVHINYNSFGTHVTYGVNNVDTIAYVDATNNWWGDPSGPSISTNPGGIGDSVGTYVTYSPWNTGTAALFFSNKTSVTGATISIPVYISLNGNSFNTLQGKFTYDNSKLSFQNATYGLGTLINTAGWTILFNENTPGTISFVGIGTTPINSDGLLFYLTFTITDNTAGSATVTGNNADFKAGGNQIFGTSGSFTGTITYTHINTTYLRGDVNLDGTVDLNDALLLQNKITGNTLNTLSDLAKQNADADLSSGSPSTVVPDDSSLTALDVSAILQYVLTGSWPSSPSPKIVSADVLFTNTSISNNNQYLHLPIAVDNATGVQTLEVTLTYNSQVADYQTFAQLKLNNGDLLDAQKVSSGVVKFVYVSKAPSTGNILPGEIVLKLNNGVPSSGVITTTYSINGSAEKTGPSYDFGVTSVESDQMIPKEFSVSQNYPNPFNPVTNIRYALPAGTRVSIIVYNILGQAVKTLVEGNVNAGIHTVQWKGDDNFGQKVGSGIYIYRVVAGSNVVVKKMILLK